MSKNVIISGFIHNHDLKIEDLDDVFENCIEQIVRYGIKIRNIDTGKNHTISSIYEYLAFRFFYKMLIQTNSADAAYDIVNNAWELAEESWECLKEQQLKEKEKKDERL